MRSIRSVVVLSCLVSLSAASAWGQSQSAFLGLVGKPVPRELARAIGLHPGEGAQVVEVVAGGPASAAGIREGDVIVNLDGRKVAGPEGLAERIGSRVPGVRVTIEVARARQRILVSVVLGTPRPGPARSDLPKAAGASVRSK